MLNLPYYYWSLIRKYTAVFGTLFNEVHIQREDGAERIKVPLSLGSKDKTLARINADPEIAKQAAIILPRMSFDMTGLRYDAERHLNAAEQILAQDGSSYKVQFNPVPYNFEFQLHVYGKFNEDVLKIVEQVLPFFTPDFTVRVELVPDMGVTMNVPIILQGVSPSDNWADTQLAEPRAIVWTMDFTMKGYLYGPDYSSGVIKFVDAPLYTQRSDLTMAESSRENTGAIDEVTVQPGLLANGSPTTNAAASIPFGEINLGDDWGYAPVIYGSLEPLDD